MNDDLIQDLKQFIAATISQQTSHLATKDDISNMATKDDISNMATKEDIKQLDEKLSNKIDNLSSFVAEAIESTNEALDSQIKDHDYRITKLEQKTA